MNSIIITSIKNYDTFLSEFQSRVDDIVKELDKRFKEYDERLCITFSTKYSTFDISIIDQSYSKSLFRIDKSFNITPIQPTKGYPNVKLIDFGETYDSFKLCDPKDDIKLIEEMFLKYKSYGYTFKELNKKLRKNEI